MIFSCNLYNFVTVFFFIGVPGFPMSSWIYIEFVVEVLLIIDLCMSILMAWLFKD